MSDTDVARRRATVLVHHLPGFTATSRDLLDNPSNLGQSQRSTQPLLTVDVGEAQSHRGGAPACKECRRFPLLAYNQRPPRLVQTGGGRSATLPSTQLVALGRLLLFGWPRRPSSSWLPLFGDRQSAALPNWTFCSPISTFSAVRGTFFGRRGCSISNATSPSVKCQAGTQEAHQVQQRLRYMRGWWFTFFFLMKGSHRTEW